METTRDYSKRKPIDLYYWPTPNGKKISIMLEECGLPYTTHAVNIDTGDQFKPEFLAFSPNNRIPAIVDSANMAAPDNKPLTVFESGAILLYLAEITGQFMPPAADVHGRYKVMEWLMWQMGGLGPMLGQAHHFRIYAPKDDMSKIEYGINRYTNEAKRLYGVMDRQLSKHTYLAGETYTIADMAAFPWTNSWANQGIDWEDYPHAKRWFDMIAARPAVQSGMAVMATARVPLTDEKARSLLFGQKQFGQK